MIRLRRASAIAALCVLASAATAYAECAWMLWDGRIANLPGVDMVWSINGTYSTANECHLDLARFAALMKQRGDQVTDPQAGTALYKRGEARGYLHCLHDTVDPRGPKAGPK